MWSNVSMFYVLCSVFQNIKKKQAIIKVRKEKIDTSLINLQHCPCNLAWNVCVLVFARHQDVLVIVADLIVGALSLH